MRKKYLALIGIAAIGLLSGCNSSSLDDGSSGYIDPGTVDGLVNDYPFMISDSSVFVKRDGSVISADVEEFTADYYDVNEFEEKYLIPAVKAYNEKKGLSYVKQEETTEKLPVALYGLEKKDNNLVLELNYQTTQDYLSFNKEINTYFNDFNTFVVCPYADLADAGISMDAAFLDENGNSVDINTVKATSGLYACVLGFSGSLPAEFTGKFQFEGEVKYITEGIVIQGDNSVRVYDSDALQYILFK